MNKLNVDDTFQMGTIRCLITIVDAFGNTPHYGFVYQLPNGKYESGWMPVYFVDNFTGHPNTTTSKESFLPVGCITNDGKLVTKAA